MDRKLTLFIDFDGTISRQDVSNAMLKRFCRGDWQRFNRLWERGEMSTADCAAAVLALMEVTPQELDDFFREQEIDPFFAEFAAWAREQGLDLYVLSDGFDNYIRIIMDKFGLNFDFWANHLEYRQDGGGWSMTSAYGSASCDQCGVCKKELIEKLRIPGRPCIYIGDGYSDACAAPSCDLILARDQLAILLQEQGLPRVEFSDFAQVRSIIESINQGDRPEKSGGQTH